MDSKTRRSLNSFVDSLANALILTKPLLSVIPTDSSAIRPLRCIHEQSSKDTSQQALNHCSGKLLTLLSEIDEQHFSLRHKVNRKKTTLRLTQPIAKKRQQKNVKQDLIIEDGAKWNNENVNLSNLQPITHNCKYTQIQSDSSQSIQLRQIIRPQYRKKIEPLHSYATPRAYLSSSEDNDDIPILRRQRVESKSNSKSDRSVSPKVEGRRKLKTQLVNISTISRGLQTNSDVSFEIDLNALGIVPRTSTESPHSTDHNRTARTQRPFQQVTDEEGIQEQQPWECDEDELEQQLRQINERLSHRRQKEGSMSRAFQTQKIFIEKDELTPIHGTQQRHKEVKTVRLSLTPPKVSPYKPRSKSPRPEKGKQGGRCKTETNERSGVIKVGVKGYKK